MQTRPLPETPGGRSPAGAEIRYSMGGHNRRHDPFHGPAMAG